MKKAVFLNVDKIDFDKCLDFSSLDKIVTCSSYPETSEDDILARVAGQNIVITKEMPVSGELIAQFPDSVEMICEAGTGFNNIDISAARAKGIAVCNIPSYSTEAVAHLVITFILNFSASLPQQQRMLSAGQFDNFTRHLLVPHFEVSGKTLGLIGGSGAIGQAVMKVALALGMKVLISSRTPRDWADPQVRSASLEELLSQSDFISIHCPLNDQTRHLINRDSLGQCKPGAYIINTARGGIINETDLIDALESGRIAGAGLDVQDPEPPALDNPLFAKSNVILTPHIGWRRLETRQRLIELIAENVAAFVAGRPVNVVS